MLIYKLQNSSSTRIKKSIVGHIRWEICPPTCVHQRVPFKMEDSEFETSPRRVLTVCWTAEFVPQPQNAIYAKWFQWQSRRQWIVSESADNQRPMMSSSYRSTDYSRNPWTTGLLPKPLWTTGLLPKPLWTTGQLLPKPLWTTELLPKPLWTTELLPKPLWITGLLPKLFWTTELLPKPLWTTGLLPKPLWTTGLLPKPLWNIGLLPKPPCSSKDDN